MKCIGYKCDGCSIFVTLPIGCPRSIPDGWSHMYMEKELESGTDITPPDTLTIDAYVCSSKCAAKWAERAAKA